MSNIISFEHHKSKTVQRSARISYHDEIPFQLLFFTGVRYEKPNIAYNVEESYAQSVFSS